MRANISATSRLGAVFGKTKRAIGGAYDDVEALQGAVERRFARRNARITRPPHQPTAPTHA